jgi:hypothetical protein
MIPPTASPSIHDTGHLLHISYMIRAQLVQIPLIAECPIVIGTYPLDPDEKPQDIHPSTLLKGVLYEEIPNATFMDRQIASHHFHETATKIHHHSIHTGSSFHQRVNSVYDDDEDDEGFTSLYSMSSREYK